MKKIFFIGLVLVFGMSAVAVAKEVKNTKVCKLYIEQAKTFEESMDNDRLSKEMLAFYKDKIRVHCGTLVAKTKFEKKSFVEMMMKSNVADKKACILAIDIASKYSKSKNQSEVLVAAYKENIADKCGDLVAAHVSNYCLHEEAR